MRRPRCARQAVIEAVPYDIDLVALHAVAPERYPFLLESTATGTPQGRHDLLFAFPGETLTGRWPERDFLTRLDVAWREARTTAAPAPDELPFRGGWFLALDYELAAAIEPTLEVPGRPGVPFARATRVPAAVVRDHATGRAWWVDEDGDPARREVFLADLAQSRARREWAWPGLDVEEAPASVFIGGVRAALDHIGAGDVYQVNLSRPWSARLADGAEAAGLYRRLVRSNPGPFAGLARHEGRTLVSSSPERLLRVVRGCIETRPIAGTRPRGSDEAADRRLQRALRESAKERAEHVMLIDLERNDLGRICVSGSVKVDELMVLESYAHVHHIVSNVSGTLRAGVTPGEVIAAVFPGGTITGCPKVRCMEIIGRLEGEPRGAYTGSMGYLNHDGSCDLNILIRTVELGDGLARFRAGSGIVADSVPERELDETRAKARGLLLALGR